MQIDTIEGLSMGGTWRLRLPAASPAGAAQIAQSALDLVDAQMSAWRPGSNCANQVTGPVGDWVQVPQETAFVISAGQALMRKAGSAFSILMGGAQAREGFVPGRADGIRLLTCWKLTGCSLRAAAPRA